MPFITDAQVLESVTQDVRHRGPPDEIGHNRNYQTFVLHWPGIAAKYSNLPPIDPEFPTRLDQAVAKGLALREKDLELRRDHLL